VRRAIVGAIRLIGFLVTAPLQMWRRRRLLLCAATAAAQLLPTGARSSSSSSSSSAPPAPPLRPHLTFVMADDLGANDVGWSDPTVLSPTIDALARGGIRLPHTYAYHWCAPSRAAFFTGRYVAMHGYEDGGDGPGAGTDGQGSGTATAVPLRFRLLPQALQSAGYETLMIGKWHLGYPTLQHTPEARGFNEYLGYLTGAEDYWTHVKTPVPQCGPTKDLWRGSSHSNGTVMMSRPANESKYFPQYSIFIFNAFLQEKIATFAAKQQEQQREQDNDKEEEEEEEEDQKKDRLFIYAAYQNVHGPLEVPRRYFDLYKDQGAGVASGANCTWERYMSEHGGKGFKCANPPGVKAEAGQNCYCNRLIVKAQVSALDEAIPGRRRGG
jgi:hypothetical protein